MKPTIVLTLLVLLIGCAERSPEKQLSELLDRDAAFKNQRDPSKAEVYNKLRDRSPTAFEEQYNFNKEILQSLLSVDRSALSTSDQISFDLIQFTKENQLKEFEFKTHLNPLLADGGFHIGLVFTAQSYEFKSKESYRNYMDLLRDIPRYMRENISLLQEGLDLGISQSQIIFDGYEVTYDNHIVEDPMKSIFYEPFKELPDTFTDAEKKQLREEAVRAVREGAIKGYKIFSDFMTDAYIPKTRTNTGASNLPNGDDYYKYLIKKFTTMELQPDSVHNLGLSEVARIKAEMQKIIGKVGFEGTFADFLQFLRTDQRFYAKSPEELLKEATYISKKMDGELPKLFGRLPRQPYTVNPVPDHLAPKYTGGRYVGADISSTKPGQYWVNTYGLENRPLYVLEALSFHEAVPGHHLQSALTQELDLPQFRRNLYLSAFGEGWGLYSEFLGKEAGFYSNPYSDFGRLTYEMWRACRLVVDTGLHSFGWTREQAMEYMASNTALSLHEIQTEVDRYISWPGQALSYKMGELKIKALRNKAEAALGDNFDVREFHDLILSQGTVTLPIMEEMVNDFISSKSK